ncbi:hypothetical protein [Paenibacillus xylanilyticus]|uniref:Lipoprotein n=1 Tax=Paenibacillus xylanilyticus TaxID=248903 RepID=A0A7Y6EUI6_9BACL|nr:hypothetical protein [Paenibacillus xylanilyticus]NUU74425.1 hypothetical protein [Paenibacillus xylanilyticus]
MKKFSWLFGFMLVAIMLVIGCSQASTPNESKLPLPNEKSTLSPTEEATIAAQVFKTKEYTIGKVPEWPLLEDVVLERYAEMEPFYAERFADKPVNYSYVLLALRAAGIQQASLQPENMKFTVYQELENYVDLDYTMDLMLDKQNGKIERVPLEGRLSLVNKDGAWLIQADDFDDAAFLKLIPQ